MRRGSGKSARIALMAPYDGGNLGGFAIQESLIANLRRMAPEIEICGITLDPAKTSALHGIPSYPLGANAIPHFHIAEAQDGKNEIALTHKLPQALKRFLRRIPFALRLKALVVEIRHAIRSYRLLRTVDLLVIGGGGQLDEEWGGAWGHPYALAKWSVLARAAGASVVFVSVGACVMESRLTKLFLKTSLRLACYRSYRDAQSRRLALSVTPRAEGPVVPDLAFSLPTACTERANREAGAVRVGVSPIAYKNAKLWPNTDQREYERYMGELADFVGALLRDGAQVTLFSSALPDDQTFTDVLDRLDPAVRAASKDRICQHAPKTVGELRDVVSSVDFVIASRLHGVLLSCLFEKPTIAISYDRKVACLTDELGQSDYCLDIHSFKSGDLARSFYRLRADREAIVRRLATARLQYEQVLEMQYQALIQQALRQGADPLHRYASELLREQAAI